MTDVAGPPRADTGQAPVSGPGETHPGIGVGRATEATNGQVVAPDGVRTGGDGPGVDTAGEDGASASPSESPPTPGGHGPTASPGVALFDQGADDADAEDGASPSVHPRLWQRRLAVLGDAGRKRLRWVVAGVSVLAAVCVVLLVLHTPLLAVRHATVQGATHTGAAAVLDAAGLAHHPPLIDVNPKTAAAQVERLPWVKRAVVVRRWPDSVVVRVTERVPVGAFALPGGQVALVDATGRVLAWEPGPAPGPTLGGPVPPGRPGTDIAVADHPVLEVAALLPDSIAGDVVSVSVDHGGALTLTLAGRVTAVLGDTVELHAKLVSLESVLEGTRVPRGSQIDVTVPGEPLVGPPPPPSRSGAGGR